MIWRRIGWTCAGLWMLGVATSGDWRSLRNGAVIGSVVWLAVHRRALRLPRRPRALEPGPTGGGGELVSLEARRRRRAA